MFDRARFVELLQDPPTAAERAIFARSELDSTSSDLLRLLKDGFGAGTVVIAGQQHRGRGRQGRSWHSPGSGNLYISLAVDIRDLTPEQVPLVPLVAGVALAEAVRGETSVPATLKWPNDLLLGGKKLAGILCELAAPGSPVLVAGMGLNWGAPDFPHELASTATSLNATSTTPGSREKIASRWVCLIEERIKRGFAEDGCQDLIADWCRLAEEFGRRVKVDDIIGETVGLNPAGQLLIKMDSGDIVSVPGGIIENV